MDSQVTIALITGIFGAVIPPLMTQVIIPLFKPKRPLGKGLGSIIIQGVIGGFIGVLIGFGISPLVTSSCTPLTSAKVDILSPVSGSSVPRLVTVQGNVCHIPRDKELWLLVVPDGVTSYYPQTGPIVVDDSGNWSTGAYLGLDDPVDAGKGFVVMAALADKQGAAAIRTYFSQGGPDFQGLEPLPLGIQLVSQVRVIRK